MTPVRPVADIASGNAFDKLAYELYDVLVGPRRGREPGTTHDIIVRFLRHAASTAESKHDLAIASLAQQDKLIERLRASLKAFADWACNAMATTPRAAIPMHVPSCCARTNRTRERRPSAICGAPASLSSSQWTRRSRMALTQKELDELLSGEPRPPAARLVHRPFLRHQWYVGLWLQLPSECVRPAARLSQAPTDHTPVPALHWGACGE